jgi:N-acetylglutamate synthase-like GNAT family acetyltransferase
LERAGSSAVIRAADIADVAGIARLHVKAWQDAYRGRMPDAYLDGLDPSRKAAAWFAAVQRAQTLILVALHNSSLVGFCALAPSRDADATAGVGEVTALYVDAHCWRSGHGTALLDAVVQNAPERGMSELTLWVLAANARARSFYEARGFFSDGHAKTDQFPGFALSELRYRRALEPVTTRVECLS